MKRIALNPINKNHCNNSFIKLGVSHSIYRAFFHSLIIILIREMYPRGVLILNKSTKIKMH